MTSISFLPRPFFAYSNLLAPGNVGWPTWLHCVRVLSGAYSLYCWFWLCLYIAPTNEQKELRQRDSRTADAANFLGSVMDLNRSGL